MNRTSKIALLALAIAPLCATAVQAETIYLKCWADDDPGAPLVIDLTNHTVNGEPAVVTPVSIDWDANNSVIDTHYHIDRATGTETVTGIIHHGGEDRIAPSLTHQCVSVSAPATKF